MVLTMFFRREILPRENIARFTKTAKESPRRVSISRIFCPTKKIIPYAIIARKIFFQITARGSGLWLSFVAR
jgi:hypothetical protein